MCSLVVGDFQVSQRLVFSNAIPKLTAYVEMLSVELDGLVVLTKPVERIAQVAERVAP